MAETATAITPESFFKLPRGAQILVAYALVNDLWELQLLKSDKDGIALVECGWLTAKPGRIHGVGNYEFGEDVWAGFAAMADEIFASISEDELEKFKERKSQSYPWLW